jgi:ribosome maturation factor RimP
MKPEGGEMSVVEAVRDVVAPLVENQGLELVDVEANGGLVRIYIDRPGGIDLDAITEATEVISRALDDRDPMPGSYTLEVSSPGLERPLTTPAHFQRFVGSQVKVRVQARGEAERRLEGLLTAADEQGIAVETGAGTTERVTYRDIERARTTFDWGPGPKPGKAAKQPKQKKRTATR